MDTAKKRISHVSSEAAVRARQKLQKKVNAASDSRDDGFELHSATQRRLAASTTTPPSPPLVRGKCFSLCENFAVSDLEIQIVSSLDEATL